ncbi:hypothetical protein V8G54_008804 [Vigna mungo]|uniref:Uncharacterized protein n=1 Tax=Vigna mungo TaxID=3915 RepID=A0AAQ3S8K1_VIGMU
MNQGPGLYFDIGKKARVEELVHGLKGLFACNIPDSGKLELRHLSRFSGFSASIGLLGDEEKGYSPVANLSGLIGTRILSLGANLAYGISATRTTNSLNTGLSLNSPYLVASVTLHDYFQSLKGCCYFEVNPLTKTAIAAEVKYDLADDEITGVTIGAQHALFPWTLLKARLSNNGRKFGRKFSVTVAGEVNLNEKDKEKRPKLLQGGIETTDYNLEKVHYEMGSYIITNRTRSREMKAAEDLEEGHLMQLYEVVPGTLTDSKGMCW